MGGKLSGPEPTSAEHAIVDGIESSLHETGQQFSEMYVCVPLACIRPYVTQDFCTGFLCSYQGHSWLLSEGSAPAEV